MRLRMRVRLRLRLRVKIVCSITINIYLIINRHWKVNIVQIQQILLNIHFTLNLQSLCEDLKLAMFEVIIKRIRLWVPDADRNWLNKVVISFLWKKSKLSARMNNEQLNQWIFYGWPLYGHWCNTLNNGDTQTQIYRNLYIDSLYRLHLLHPAN